MENLRYRLLENARNRARRKGVPFDIEIEDIQIPEYCPVLNTLLTADRVGKEENNPSLDRVVPRLGYTKGNICVISQRANRLKTDGTKEELLAIAEYIDSMAKEC